MTVVWSDNALRRIEEIVSWYESEAGADFARDWLDGVLDRPDVLVEHPDIGREVPEVGRATVRELFYRDHRIIYELDRKKELCTVLAVRHVRQKTTQRNFAE